MAGRSGPVYQALADAIAEAVASGILPPGQRLPTHRDLAWTLGITVTTVTKAYQEARRRGLVEGEVGRGTFVREQVTLARPTEFVSAINRYVPKGMRPPESVTEENSDPTAPVDFTINLPAMFDQPALLAATLQEIATSPAGVEELLTYQHPGGLRRHREAAARWLQRRGLRVTADDVLITCGAQHGLQICANTLLRPGDVILTEVLTWPGLKVLATQLDLRVEPVAVDGDGIIPDALEEAIRLHSPKLLYTMPTLQNPLAITMPEERRRQIAAILERHGVYALEDDAFGMMSDPTPPPLIRFMPRFGIYIGGTSKSMAPGLRVGYVVAPADLMQRLTQTLWCSCSMAPPLMIEVASRWIDNGVADRINQMQREDLAIRRRLADEILNPAITGIHHRSDPQSCHLWLPLPSHWREEAFLEQMQRMGAIAIASQVFAVGRQRPAPGIRVCLSVVPTHQRLQQGLWAVAKVLAMGPDHSIGVV